MKQSADRPLSAADFQQLAGVSAEAMSCLEPHLELLKKWQAKMNLVGETTMDDPWRRHFLDSAQLVPLIPPAAKVIVDLGSGAGFPGLVLAVLGDWRVHLIESNGRKAAYLREATRTLGVAAEVHNHRIESMAPIQADVVTARACAPLPRLLEYARPFCTTHTICLFHKGRGYREELTDSRKTWQINTVPIPSRADPEGVVLKIEGVFPHDR